MVGEPQRHRRLLEDVAALYDWIDAQLAQNADRAGRCGACGKCCDFDAYDHLLFVTPPELIYLAESLKVDRLKKMDAGRCPYQGVTECSVHAHRFSGCRIFCCTGDASFQSELTEAALKRLKAICERYEIPYRYADLATALAAPASDTCQSAAEPCPED
ncbi:MAG: YkgJ family cysteine cluster protein [Planctomycetota bacterium]|jgi:Fe-S-cluster containining protein